ncbi:putative regulator [Vibrio maritimus]|uniref:Putative regulator n=1 Tax=Vibrio maritimus TaxID=990268 RepID=A0A090S5R3_9VIBR|nr:putative regulator [Vibrio maritimus]
MSASAKLREKLAAKKKSIQANSGQRADVMRIPMGKHKFRILPAHKDAADDQFWADFGLHYIKGDEKDATSGRNKVKAVYVCVDKTFEKPCDVCAAIEEAARHASDDEQLELIEEAKCRRAEILLNVVHRNSSDKSNIAQILQMTPTTFEKVIDIMEEYPEMIDPKEGIDLLITREGTGLNTKYNVMPAAKSEPVPDEVLDTMTNLQDFVQQEHEDGLKKALSAVNATVGLLVDRAPTAKAGTKAIASKPTKVEDDMMEVMDDELLDGIEDAEFEEAELKATGTDDAVASTGGGAGDDLDDIDDILADLDDL